MCVSEKGIYFYSAADEKEFYFNHLVDPYETRNRAYTIGEGQNTSNTLRKVLIDFLKKNNMIYSISNIRDDYSWKLVDNNNLNKSPDKGFIFQDQPWSKHNLEGYSQNND